MTKSELARQAALDRVGDAYVYGAWDQYCTVQNRNKYAKLSDTYADKIKQYCPRMSGKSDYCDGCKYLGHRIHDCRGLTSTCAKAAGIATITGQTVGKQWNADTWAIRGPIDTLPDVRYAQLFRHDGQKWAHTGCYIGNGETVDARSHAKGVIRGKLSDYKWTHWAIPKGMEDDAGSDAGQTSFVGSADTFPKGEGSEGGETVIYSALVTTDGGRLNVRSAPGYEMKDGKRVPKGEKIGALPNGEKIDVHMEYDLDKDGRPDWAFMAGDGLNGYVAMEYLTPIDRPESAQDATDGGGVQTPTDEEEALSAQDSAQGWGVYIPCDNLEEAKRYAGNVKGARIIKIEEPPGVAGGEGE